MVLFHNQLGFTFTHPDRVCVCLYFVLTLSCEYCDWYSWITELDEGPSFIDAQSVPGQKDVLSTNKAMDQLFVLLQTHTNTTK